MVIEGTELKLDGPSSVISFRGLKQVAMGWMLSAWLNILVN